MIAPDLEPDIVGVTYMPPYHVETAWKVNLLNSAVLNITTEQPLGP